LGGREAPKAVRDRAEAAADVGVEPGAAAEAFLLGEEVDGRGAVGDAGVGDVKDLFAGEGRVGERRDEGFQGEAEGAGARLVEQ